MSETNEEYIARQQDDSVHEATLASSWNIPRSALTTIRKSRLRENWHWKYGPNKGHADIRITPEGIKELKKWMSPLDPPQLVDPPEHVQKELQPWDSSVKKGYPFTEPIPVEKHIAIVWRIPINPRLLHCLGSDGEVVSVRIRSTKMFRKGMKIDLDRQCVRLNDGSATNCPTYAFRGKLPRSYGRW